MEINVTYTFTEHDKELLKTVLPPMPCDHCGFKQGCCGCPEYTEYRQKVQEYKNAGVYEMALEIRRREDLLNEIVKLTQECLKINQKLPDFAQANFNPDNTYSFQYIAEQLPELFKAKLNNVLDKQEY